jgi:glycosyltransferase involved in cell wall biosynthesis
MSSSPHNHPTPPAVQDHPDLPSRIEISVVIPVFNEVDNLKALHEELTNVLEGIQGAYEIIFVDDGSTDGSFSILEDLHQADDHVHVIQFRRNFGQSAAFAAGFEHARGDTIITLDADGQNNPADIPRLLEKMQTNDLDFVTGWRINRKEPFLRRILSNTANHLITRSSGVIIHDRGCSLKVFKHDLVKNLHLYGELHRFLPELVSSIGAKVAEIKVEDRPRRYGRSKYGSISRTPRVFLDLFTVFFLMGFFTSPMRFFGTIAIVITSIGTLIIGILGGTKIYYGITQGLVGFHAYQIGNRPLFLLSMVVILVGVQFLMMGLLGEMIMRTYFEAGDKPPYYIRQVLS